MAFDLNDPEAKQAIETAVKTALQAERKTAAEAEAGLKAKNEELLAKLAKGKLTEEEQTAVEKDQKELEEFRKTQSSAEEERALKAGEFDKLKEQLVKKHVKEMETEKGISAKLKASLEANLIDAASLAAISTAKGSTVILLPHVKRHVKMVELNGSFVARVVDQAGTIRIGDEQGNPMSIDQLVAEMKTDEVFAPVFEGSGAGGGGTPPSGGGGKPPSNKTMSRTEFGQLDPGQKAAYMKEGGTLTDG